MQDTLDWRSQGFFEFFNLLVSRDLKGHSIQNEARSEGANGHPQGSVQVSLVGEPVAPPQVSHRTNALWI